jgi:hypothetical protein
MPSSWGKSSHRRTTSPSSIGCPHRSISAVCSSTARSSRGQAPASPSFRRSGRALFHPLLEAFHRAFPKGVVNKVYGKGAEVVPPLLGSGKVNVPTLIGSSKVADHFKKLPPSSTACAPSRPRRQECRDRAAGCRPRAGGEGMPARRAFLQRAALHRAQGELVRNDVAEAFLRRMAEEIAASIAGCG